MAFEAQLVQTQDKFIPDAPVVVQHDEASLALARRHVPYTIGDFDQVAPHRQGLD